MKIFGRYPYAAEAIPKRARKPQRTVLYGLIEYDIAEIRACDMTEDALVMQGQVWVSGGSEGIFSRPGWNGRLWIRRNNPSIDGLRGELQNPGNIHRLHGTIHERVYDHTFGPRSQRNDIDPKAFYDDAFAGEVLWNDKAAAHDRAVAAARDLVIVDEHVYRVDPCPVWGVYRSPNSILVGARPSGGNYRHHGEHAFRPDRRDDVMEWVRRQGELTLYGSGEVRHIEPEFIDRDDLSHYVAMRLPHLAAGPFLELLPHLAPEAFAAWRKIAPLAAALDPLSPDKPLPAGHDPAAVARDVIACYDAVAAIPHLPTHAAWRLSELTRIEMKPFKERLAFEAERRPAPATAPADDEALARLGPA